MSEFKYNFNMVKVFYSRQFVNINFLISQNVLNSNDLDNLWKHCNVTIG